MRLDENREQVLIKTEDEIEDGWDTTQVTVSFSKKGKTTCRRQSYAKIKIYQKRKYPIQSI